MVESVKKNFDQTFCSISYFKMIEIGIVKTISLLSGVTDNVGFVWPAGASIQDCCIKHHLARLTNELRMLNFKNKPT